MKHISVLFAFLLLALHACLCLLEIFGRDISTPKWAQLYTGTLLEQPWSELGSDVSTSSINLEFKAYKKTGWSEWQDASAAFSYDTDTPIERLEQGINDHMRWQLTHNLYSENGRVQLNRVLESPAYAEALYYVIRMNEFQDSISPDSTQLRLAIQFTPAMDKAYTTQLSYFNFPVYSKP